MEKVALVTGGVTGIGRAISEALINEDYSVVVCDIDDHRGLALEKQFRDQGRNLFFFRCDVTDEEQIRLAVDFVMDRFQRLDALINNAGITRRRGKEILTSDWDELFQVNSRGPFIFCKYVSEIMKKQRSGKIINISSIAGKMGDLLSAPGYGPSKAALNCLTKTFAKELAAYNVTVNAIAPHAIETEMIAQLPEEKRREVAKAIPLQRLGKPSEVAATVTFLLSEGANYITGEIIDVNGGYLMD